MLNLVWVNGRPANQISTFDRGLAFGDGLFETIARSGGRWVLWHEHLERLNKGLEVLGIQVDLHVLMEDWSRFSEECGTHGVAKMVVTRGESMRGYVPPCDVKVTTILQWFPGLPAAPRALSLGVCKIKLASQPAFAGLKHLNRLEQVLASREVRDNGWDDGLLLNCAGHVIETTSKNLFMFKEGVLTTPSVSDCGVAGTLRNWILNNFPVKQLDSEVGVMIPRVESVSLGDVLEADEVFVCNSVLGILPVKQVDGRDYGRWPLTLELRDWVAQAWGIGA